MDKGQFKIGRIISVRRASFVFIFMLVAFSFLFPSCIKQLEKEGIYDTTLCSGVLLDQRTNNPVAD
ncbi:MAG: hypothetical protein II575_12445, partial [Bacteroidales bacterium]|nr:hypothetical protein [Bacteroidales bacterium]